MPPAAASVDNEKRPARMAPGRSRFGVAMLAEGPDGVARDRVSRPA